MSLVTVCSPSQLSAQSTLLCLLLATCSSNYLTLVARSTDRYAEAVIKQTGVYAPSRKGRLGVFWGDQVFIPSAPTTYTPTHHIDIMCTLGDMVGEEEVS